MGAYINPPDETKEEWLERHGRLVVSPTFESCPFGSYIVALVNNGLFTAARIAYDREQFEAVTPPVDISPKKFYYVEADRLWDVSNLGEFIEKPTGKGE